MDPAASSSSLNAKFDLHHIWCSVAIAIACVFGSVAAQAESSANKDQPNELIETLIALPINSKQLDPSFLKDYDSRLVAASLLERNRRFQQRWTPQTPVSSDFPTDKDVEILSLVPAANVKSLLKNGQLNLHQTKHTRGAFQLSRRAELEDLMLGIVLEDKYNASPTSPIHNLRPKYGLVNFLKPCGVKINPQQHLLDYGDILVVYRDEVKRRATYTYSDSLSGYFVTVDGPSKPRMLCDLTAPVDKSRVLTYVEAQVWGAIDLADIAEFRIPEQRNDLLRVLKPAGLPIYSYDRERFARNTYPLEVSQLGLNRVKLLYPGDSSLIDSYAERREKRMKKK